MCGKSGKHRLKRRLMCLCATSKVAAWAAWATVGRLVVQCFRYGTPQFRRITNYTQSSGGHAQCIYELARVSRRLQAAKSEMKNTFECFWININIKCRCDRNNKVVVEEKRSRTEISRSAWPAGTLINFGSTRKRERERER